MSSPIFWRLVWKEYRRLRGFWLGVAVLAVLVNLVVIAFGPPGTWAGNLQAGIVNFLFAVALGAAALYAAGAAAVIFAAEHEEKTLEFLSLLPSESWPVFGGKIVTASASAVALAVALGLVATILSGGRLPAGEPTREILAILGVGMLEVFVWGVLCSLLLKRPLVAALLGIFLASCGVAFAVSIAEPVPAQRRMTEAYVKAVPCRLILVALVGMIDVYLARHWIRGQVALNRAIAPRKRLGVESATGAQVSSGLRPPLAGLFRLASGGRKSTDTLHRKPPALPILGRLIWQSWRQSRRTLLAFFAVGLILVPLTIWTVDYERTATIAKITFILCAVHVTFQGTNTFRFDQERQRCAFFAESAERPRLVWLSRLAVWGGAAILLIVVMCVAAAMAISPSVPYRTTAYLCSSEILRAIGERSSPYNADEAGEIAAVQQVVRHSVALMILGFAVGQFCSMAVRSGVMAGFLAFVLMIVGTFWIAIVGACQLSLIWAVGPLVLAFLVASWWRAPSWILQRRTIRTWLAPIAILIGTWFLTMAGAAHFRVTEARQPFWFPGIAKQVGRSDAVQFVRLPGDTPEARKTGQMYLRAAEILNSDSQGAVQLALEATKREECILPEHVFSNEMTTDNLFTLLRQVYFEGRATAAKGDPDAALEYFLAALKMRRHLVQHQPVHIWASISSWYGDDWGDGGIMGSLAAVWATAPGQSPEDLKRAIDALNDSCVRPPRVEEALVASWNSICDIVMGTDGKMPSFLNDEGGGRLGQWLAFTANRLPWERERALRVLEATHDNMAYDWSGFRQLLSHSVVESRGVGKVGEKVRTFVNNEYWPGVHYGQWKAYLLSPPRSWLRTTYLVSDECKRQMDIYYLVRVAAELELRRRATQLRMALIAWHLEHGKYPESLGPLVPGYFESLPRDPYSDETFQYRAHGFQELPADDPDAELIRTTPVLWSVGRFDSKPYRVYDEDGKMQYAYSGEGRTVFPFPKLPPRPAPTSTPAAGN